MNKSTDMSKARRRIVLWLLCCLVAVFIFSAYSNSLFAPFTLDDSHSFVTEPKVLGFSFSLPAISELAKTKFGLYRFLPMLSFALDLQWGAGSIMAFHVTNIIIHLLATMALFFLLTSLFDLNEDGGRVFLREGRNSVGIIAICIVGIWSLSPLQTNAVTYLVQRMTSMATLFYFLSLACYLKGRKQRVSSHDRIKMLGWYACGLLSWLCAMMSKQIAITLPVILLLVEWLFIDNSGLFEFVKRHKVVVCTATLVLSSLIFYKISTGMLDGYAHRHFSLSERLLTELRVVAAYVALLLLPLPGLLTLEHDISLSTSLFSPVSTSLSLLFIGALIIGGWKVRKKYPLITFGLYWFFINLLLESTIFPLELMFEHRLYLPSAGFYLACFMVVYELYGYFSRKNYHNNRSTVMISTMVILFSCLSLSTYYRNTVWQDSVTLYQDCLKKAPCKPRVHSNLAKAYADRGEYKKAIAESDKALVLGVKGYEEYWVTASNIIASMSRMADNQGAIARAKILLRDAPPEAKKNAYPLFLLHLGNIYLAEGEYQHAFDYYAKGFQFSTIYDLPFTASFEDNMICTLETGLQEGFSFKGELAIARNGRSAAYEKMAAICFELRNDELALHYCDCAQTSKMSPERCVEIKKKIAEFKVADRIQQEKGTIRTKYYNNPVASLFNFYMATAYALVKTGFPFESAVQYFLQAAKKIHPDNIDVMLLSSWLYYKKKSYGEAVREVDKAIALDKDYAQLWINRGIYCLASGKNNEALAAFKKVLILYPDYPHGKKLEAMMLAAERGKAEKILSHEYHHEKGEYYGWRQEISG